VVQSRSGREPVTDCCCVSLREAQRRSNPSSWIATPSFLRLAMTSRNLMDAGKIPRRPVGIFYRVKSRSYEGRRGRKFEGRMV
jgi:hypothetical protein